MERKYISSKTINFNYVTGKKVNLKIGDKFEYSKSLIFYADDKKIGISIAQNPLFEKGVKCSLEFLYLENMLVLEGVIKTFEDGILYLSIPRNVAIKQQRGDLRVNCSNRCNIEKFTTGKIKNLSAGGAFISLDTPIDFSLFDENSFKVCFNINNTDLRLTCASVEYGEKFIRVKFKNLKEDIKNFISDYCCLVDAENFRRNKR